MAAGSAGTSSGRLRIYSGCWPNRGAAVVRNRDDMVIEEATRRLVSELRPTSVYLFGSRARGTATADSDFDFFVRRAG